MSDDLRQYTITVTVAGKADLAGADIASSIPLKDPVTLAHASDKMRELRSNLRANGFDIVAFGVQLTPDDESDNE